MTLPDYTTQDPATYKANIDAEIASLNDATDRGKVYATQSTANVATGIGGGDFIMELDFDTVDGTRGTFDLLGDLDTATGDFQPVTAGYYYIEAHCTWTRATNNLGEDYYFWIVKNGSQIGDSVIHEVQSTTTAPINMRVSCLVYMNGTTDKIQIKAQNGSTSSRSVDGQLIAFMVL